MNIVSYYSYARGRHRPEYYETFSLETLEQGWTPGNTFVCILHPRDPQQFLKLDPGPIAIDEDGEVRFYTWELNDKNINEYCKVRTRKETVLSMILCCIKN